MKFLVKKICQHENSFSILFPIILQLIIQFLRKMSLFKKTKINDIFNTCIGNIYTKKHEGWVELHIFMSHLKWFTTATPWSVQMKPRSTELEQTSQSSIVDLAVTGSKEMISCIKILIYQFQKYLRAFTISRRPRTRSL